MIFRRAGGEAVQEGDGLAEARRGLGELPRLSPEVPDDSRASRPGRTDTAVTLGLASMSDSRSSAGLLRRTRGPRPACRSPRGRGRSDCSSAPDRCRSRRRRDWPGRAPPASPAPSRTAPAPRPACRYPQSRVPIWASLYASCWRNSVTAGLSWTSVSRIARAASNDSQRLVGLADRVQRVADRVVAMRELAAEFGRGRGGPGPAPRTRPAPSRTTPPPRPADRPSRAGFRWRRRSPPGRCGIR